ncbi:PhoX family protein [Cellvibrio japonicus]|uniref:Tat (Twin-arginine translocation) pathway signal sequence domain protein n=1 Tax=Cellvibrio japonicus (strain Ueda107) TaxID=498211 RepID=B3PE60_CELJU|nr:PhoX family phosphatase [Cellvibrio japonicus]ACE84125.1 Tat (twin-arginine translocation) pathway signal sequence domain protein [Cellvibrio japonicus Ueda107]QEI12104.1 PhoX family phosphatase [Cellvibrio japonicus]QEI15678.1 PhoX family phosphatase [Cellvibrio japonicus]QEI19256.1 PhoX family phosphatase [Cellvibrio japonicus]
MTDQTVYEIDNSGIEPLNNRPKGISFAEVMTQRRQFLKGSLSTAVAAFMGASLVSCGGDDDKKSSSSSSSSSSSTPSSSSSSSSSSSVAPLLGFAAIATTRTDTITVPAGYSATAFVPWGTPLTGNLPAYKDDASNSGADQEQQVGTHHDGIHFYPIDAKTTGNNSNEGLLVMNHEYFDPNLIHTNGVTLGATRPTDEVRKEIAAHGVSVIHIRQNGSQWEVVSSSPFNRRITGATPMDIRGPAAGSSLLATKYSPNGTSTRGTLNNCGMGSTPWNTYLTAEENWAGYFVNKDAAQPREHSAYGVPSSNGRYYWELAESGSDEYVRFDASTKGDSALEDYRNEPNTFGWMVEIDPFDPEGRPQKRTALGRFGHEGVIFAPAVEGQPVVCYSGDDSTNEYIYKFVSAEPYYKATAGGWLLNSGTLYVAKFNSDGTGEWLPLDITNANFIAKAATAGVSFANQADVLVNTRLAADVMGATPMDRPEWGAVHPDTGEVYFTLTNNTGRTQTDAANPRANNATGHIIRWRENANGTSFNWDIFLLGGDVGTTTGEGTAAVALTAENHFASPDGLWIDQRGVLWIQTDMSGSQQSAGPFGNNQMLAADPVTKETKRFLVGPTDCEITGITATPDLKTLFINIQHPGDRSTPTNFTSNWPEGGSARPRSATVIITKNDGGVIGA